MSAVGVSEPVPARRGDFEVIGTLARPVVVVLGGISASAHVAAHGQDRRPGWWEDMVGPGKALDPAQFCIVGVDHAVGPSRGVTTRDQARVVHAVLDQLGVAKADAIVGASYGGMTALTFAELFPRRVRRVVALCAAHRPDPMATAIRVIQRRILRLGWDSGRAREALELARCLGMVSYRSAEEFAGRFGGKAAWTTDGPRFPVEGYLDHQASRFAERFTVGRYLALSESLDLHECEPGLITTPVTLVASRSDAVVPLRQVRELAAQLAGPVRLHVLDAITGHDAFLTEVAAVSSILTDALGGEACDAW
jgi:homoserine O-acetyltransferase